MSWWLIGGSPGVHDSLGRCVVKVVARVVRSEKSVVCGQESSVSCSWVA